MATTRFDPSNGLVVAEALIRGPVSSRKILVAIDTGASKDDKSRAEDPAVIDEATTREYDQGAPVPNPGRRSSIEPKQS